MEPTIKDQNQGIIDFNNKLSGDDKIKAIAEDRCIGPPMGCGGPATEFTDYESKEEFGITGMCQQCQDAFFG